MTDKEQRPPISMDYYKKVEMEMLKRYLAYDFDVFLSKENKLLKEKNKNNIMNILKYIAIVVTIIALLGIYNTFFAENELLIEEPVKVEIAD